MRMIPKNNNPIRFQNRDHSIRILVLNEIFSKRINTTAMYINPNKIKIAFSIKEYEKTRLTGSNTNSNNSSEAKYILLFINQEKLLWYA